MGNFFFVVEIKVAQSKIGVDINQWKYAFDILKEIDLIVDPNILEEIGLLDCQSSDTTLDPNVKLLPD